MPSGSAPIGALPTTDNAPPAPMDISAAWPPFTAFHAPGLAPDPSINGAAAHLPLGAMAKPSGPVPGVISDTTCGCGPDGSIVTSASPLMPCAPVPLAMTYLPSGVPSMLEG